MFSTKDREDGPVGSASSVGEICFAKFASTERPVRMNGVGSSVEAV